MFAIGLIREIEMLEMLLEPQMISLHFYSSKESR